MIVLPDADYDFVGGVMRKILFALGAFAALAAGSETAGAAPYDLTSGTLSLSPGDAEWSGSFTPLAGMYNLVVSIPPSVSSPQLWLAVLDLTSAVDSTDTTSLTFSNTGSASPTFTATGGTYFYTFDLFGKVGGVDISATNPPPSGVSAQVTAVPGPIAGSGLGGLIAAVLAGAFVFARRNGSLSV